MSTASNRVYLLSGSLVYFDDASDLSAINSGRAFSGHGGNMAYNAALLGDASSIILVGRAGRDFGPYANHLNTIGVSTENLEGANGPTARSWESKDEQGNQHRLLNIGVMARAVRAPEIAFSESCAFWYLGPEHAENMCLLANQAIRQHKKYFLNPGFSMADLLSEEYDRTCSLEAMIKSASGLLLTEGQLAEVCLTLGVARPEIWDCCPKLEFVVERKSAVVDVHTSSQTYSVCLGDDNLSEPGKEEAFNAGFLSGYLKNWDVEKCAKLGSAMSTFVREEQLHRPALPEILAKAFG